MAKARPIPGIGKDDAFASVAARVIETRTQELVEHSEGVLDLGDIERLHDMRVATRRLRAALEVFQPCFPKKRYKAAHREVKGLADALGERRDRDVTLEALDRFAAGLGAADRPGVAQPRGRGPRRAGGGEPAAGAERHRRAGRRRSPSASLSLAAAARALVEPAQAEAPEAPPESARRRPSRARVAGARAAAGDRREHNGGEPR